MKYLVCLQRLHTKRCLLALQWWGFRSWGLRAHRSAGSFGFWSSCSPVLSAPSLVHMSQWRRLYAALWCSALSRWHSFSKWVLYSDSAKQVWFPLILFMELYTEWSCYHVRGNIPFLVIFILFGPDSRCLTHWLDNSWTWGFSNQYFERMTIKSWLCTFILEVEMFSKNAYCSEASLKNERKLSYLGSLRDTLRRF